jgi:DNA-dependent RNA polymerase auxiliary subunit epsilon
MTLLGGALGMLVVGGVFVYNEGAVRVDVREKTPNVEHIYLVVPAVVLPVAARLVPRNKLKDVPRNIGPWLPTIKAASEELARCPDGPLVEVDSNREQVRIRKQGRSLFIDVDSEEETVHVSFPLQAAADTVSQLVRQGQAN